MYTSQYHNVTKLHVRFPSLVHVRLVYMTLFSIEQWNQFETKSIRSNANVDLSPKSIFLDVQTTFRHTFLSSNLKCLPCGDPRAVCGNTGIRLLTTH